MKHASLAVVALVLAACGQKPSPAPSPKAAPAPAASTTPAPTAPFMSGMAPAAAAAAGIGESTGEVTAIDAAGGTVTLKHKAITGVGWPAMTMTFTATPPALLNDLKVGDKVKFAVRIEGDKNLVTAISKR